jgi:hypothetical protein
MEVNAGSAPTVAGISVSPLSASVTAGAGAVSVGSDWVESSSGVDSSDVDGDRRRHPNCRWRHSRPGTAHAQAKGDVRRTLSPTLPTFDWVESSSGVDSSGVNSSDVDGDRRRHPIYRRRHSRRGTAHAHAKSDAGRTMSPTLPTNVIAEAMMAASTTFCGVQVRSKTRVPFAWLPEINHPLAYPSIRVEEPRFGPP